LSPYPFVKAVAQDLISTPVLERRAAAPFVVLTSRRLRRSQTSMSTSALQALGTSVILAAFSFHALGADRTDRQSAPKAGEVEARIDWSKAQQVLVRLLEYQFVPDHIVLRRGVPYRLQLANDGTEIHDFTAPEFFRAVRLKDPQALGSSSANIVIKPHAQKEVDLVADQPGSYPVSCADHDWAGMTGTIIVE
jgi:plastocyanin